MNGYRAFIKKEWMENIRNYRLLIMFALFLIFGMLGPLSAKLMPELIATLTPDLQITMAEPTALDSWAQFYKNISQLGFSIMLILFSNCLASEYAKGTLVNVLTKGLPKPAVVLAKFFVAAGVMTLSYWMCYGVTYGYTAYLWPDASLQHTTFAAFALWIMGILYLSMLIFGCVMFRQAFSSIVFSLAASVVLSLTAFVKQMAAYSPIVLVSKNMDLLAGTAKPSELTIPVILAVSLSAAFVYAAVAMFNQKSA